MLLLSCMIKVTEGSLYEINKNGLNYDEAKYRNLRKINCKAEIENNRLCSTIFNQTPLYKTHNSVHTAFDHMQYFASNKERICIKKPECCRSSGRDTFGSLDLSLCLEREKAFGFRRKVDKLRDVDEETCD